MGSVGGAALLVEIGGQAREISLAGRAVYQIGRGETNDLTLPDALVSRQHATIQQQKDGTHLLVDSGSRNGTFLNGARLVLPTILAGGSRIRIGPYQITYLADPTLLFTSPMASLATTAHQVEVAIVTAVVVDIRGFTSLSTQVDAVTLSGAVGSLWRDASVILQECGAWGRQALGDGLLALWNHGSSCPLAGQIAPSLSGIVRLAALAETFNRHSPLPLPLRLGAGMNTGEAAVGSPGNALSGENLVLGETVNRAFRLESATRQIECDCLIGERTWKILADVVPPNFAARHELTPKGYSEPVPAYALSFADLEKAIALLS